MDEVNLRTIEWQAPEYTHKEKSADFIWTIGLVAILGVILAVWFGNYLFAIFIFISGSTLIMFTLRKPKSINFSISNAGISMGKDKYAWVSIRGFDIKNIKYGDINEQLYDKLMLVTSKYFLPVYTVPLPKALAEEVKENLLLVIPNIDIEESRSMLFMEKLGF